MSSRMLVPKLESEFEGQVYQTSDEERRESAELVALLERELGLDLRRIRVSVRGGSVWVQGCVAGHDQRRALEGVLKEHAEGRTLQVKLSLL